MPHYFLIKNIVDNSIVHNSKGLKPEGWDSKEEAQRFGDKTLNYTGFSKSLYEISVYEDSNIPIEQIEQYAP